MGLSARKRLSIGPATVHMSASKYGPSSSMSVGTKNRKKGQVNVTYNSKRGLTVSLYGTGIKWKSTKKGMGKTGLTKAQISDRAKSNRLKKENQSKSNKYQKEREARLKLSADVKAKESEIYSFVVDKLSVAGNEIDNFIGKEDEKISKLKDNNLATAELCEEVFSKIIVKIEKICKKEISIKVPERFLTEKGTGYSNTISIHEINLNLNDFFGFELDLCKIDTDRNRVLVDEPKFLGYFYDRYSQGAAHKLSSIVSRCVNNYSIESIANISLPRKEIILSKFGLSNNFSDYKLFDYEDESMDQCFKDLDKELAEEIVRDAVENLENNCVSILEDGVIDDDEMHLLVIFIKRYIRLVSLVTGIICVESKERLSLVTSQLRVELFSAGSSFLFSEWEELELSQIMNKRNLSSLNKAVRKYSQLRKLIGKNGKLETNLPLVKESSQVLDSINKEIQESILVFIGGLSDLLSELAASAKNRNKIKEENLDFGLVLGFQEAEFFDIFDKEFTLSPSYQDFRISIIEKRNQIKTIIKDEYKKKLGRTEIKAEKILKKYQKIENFSKLPHQKLKKALKDIGPLISKYTEHDYVSSLVVTDVARNTNNLHSRILEAMKTKSRGEKIYGSIIYFSGSALKVIYITAAALALLGWILQQLNIN